LHTAAAQAHGAGAAASADFRADVRGDVFRFAIVDLDRFELRKRYPGRARAVRQPE
jgi:hypothetical protein